MYQLPELTKFPNLLHAFSEVSDGNMSFRWGSREDVEENRTMFFRRIGIAPASCVGVGVHHGVSVGRVGAEERGQGMEYGDTREMPEAFLTDAPETFLFLLTGDCLPIIFYDPERHVVGLAHVSRHNTPLRIAEAVLIKLEEWYETRPCDVVVGIGPGVREPSYRFPPALCEELKPVWGVFARDEDVSGCLLDVPGWNVGQLLDMGVRREHIVVAPRDTFTDHRFFSHARRARKGETEGRFATVVGLKE
jgi:copper oxidase (laccase) domain-containing protein